MFFIDFPILSYPIQPNATTCIGYTKSYGNPRQSNLLSSCLQIIRHATHQKDKSLRAAFLSKLDNSVNSNSIFNTKYAELFTTWQVFFHFHNPTCAYNQPNNIHQKSSPLLQSTFTSVFNPYFLTKLSLKSLLH